MRDIFHIHCSGAYAAGAVYMSKNGRALNRENRKLIEHRMHRCAISPLLSSLVRFYTSNSQNVASYPLRPLPVFALSPLSQSFPSPPGPYQCSTLAKRTEHYLFNFLSHNILFHPRAPPRCLGTQSIIVAKVKDKFGMCPPQP